MDFLSRSFASLFFMQLDDGGQLFRLHSYPEMLSFSTDSSFKLVETRPYRIATKYINKKSSDGKECRRSNRVVFFKSVSSCMVTTSFVNLSGIHI